MSLTFYTNPMSRGRIARWMLEETGAAYETRYLRYGPEMSSADYTAVNPMRKVPAIVHDGKVVTECAAICLYLADAFPKADLAPPLDARADYYRWMLFAAGPWEAASTNRSLNVEVSPETSGMVGYGDFDRTLDALLSAVPDEGYLLGPKFSALDVYMGSQISWGSQFGSIPKTLRVEAYLERLQSRRGYIRASELDDAAMATYGPAG
ncbi:MAG: glutathione S-transferase [Hyphomonas sp.]|uniref:glutathione S-transferase family protein n=1 Tax=Hyphomonas sp. TaxID=87 RepID=UPI0025B8FA5C|nr:glutathione S-transferase family protein [Hyphomonas sp.]MBA4338786.1 glutathione S-transferase [Hyphomonas sp.]